jgi:hypothetical protein
MLREVIVDVPSASLAASRTFWSEALLARPRVVGDAGEYTALDDPAALPHVALQDVGTTPARYHLDLESDDVEAEVDRLVGLGATVVSRHKAFAVLADPSGLLLCVLPPESDEFASRSRPVG